MEASSTAMSCPSLGSSDGTCLKKRALFDGAMLSDWFEEKKKKKKKKKSQSEL
jgi:hypothetical protein